MFNPRKYVPPTAQRFAIFRSNQEPQTSKNTFATVTPLHRVGQQRIVSPSIALHRFLTLMVDPPDGTFPDAEITLDTTSWTMIVFGFLHSGNPGPLDLQDDIARVLFRELKRHVTGYDFTRSTTEPQTPYMKLMTFHGLFTHMQRVLSSRIKNSDLYINELTQEEREKISRAWKDGVSIITVR
ncbi:hypothetical protein EI94DRAFT_1806710 [Lactarius quietus]|nr:hypothetical protein EI94DRAFT_1806710 [Lactarius quietus]